jgi:hypothetical protein
MDEWAQCGTCVAHDPIFSDTLTKPSISRATALGMPASNLSRSGCDASLPAASQSLSLSLSLSQLLWTPLPQLLVLADDDPTLAHSK